MFIQCLLKKLNNDKQIVLVLVEWTIQNQQKMLALWPTSNLFNHNHSAFSLQYQIQRVLCYLPPKFHQFVAKRCGSSYIFSTHVNYTYQLIQTKIQILDLQGSFQMLCAFLEKRKVYWWFPNYMSWNNTDVLLCPVLSSL